MVAVVRPMRRLLRPLVGVPARVKRIRVLVPRLEAARRNAAEDGEVDGAGAAGIGIGRIRQPRVRARARMEEVVVGRRGQVLGLGLNPAVLAARRRRRRRLPAKCRV
jgi:hypothetical protein